MKEIFEKLKADFEYITKKKLQGLIHSIFLAFASRLSEFANKINYITKQAFVATAEKNYLYAHAAYMLPPKPAERSKGTVVFVGTEDTVVPAGTELQSGNVFFKTTAETKIKQKQETLEISRIDGDDAVIDANEKTRQFPSGEYFIDGIKVYCSSIEKEFRFSVHEAGGVTAGSTVYLEGVLSDSVNVICEQAGTLGNKDFGFELKTKITIEGIDFALVGSTNIVGGKDEEDTEVYRQRVLKHIRNPQAPFTANSIRNAILEQVPSIKYVWVYTPIEIVNGVEKEKGGHVQIDILNYNNDSTDDEKKKCEQVVETILPAQVGKEFVKVKEAATVPHQVIIKNLFPVGNEAMREDVEKEIRHLFTEPNFDKGLTNAEIAKAIYEVEEVQSFEITSGSFGKVKKQTLLGYLEVKFRGEE